MAVTTLHGRGGMLYLQGSGANATKLGAARMWKFAVDKALDENNQMGDSWVTQLVGFLKFTGSLEGNLDTTETSPFDAAVAVTTKKFYFYPDLTATSRYYYGTAWVKLSVDESLDKVVRYTCDFDGDGQLAFN